MNIKGFTVNFLGDSITVGVGVSDIENARYDNRIAKMIPPLIHANRSADDFRRAMQAQFQHYVDRRHFIDEQLAPI